MTVYVDKLKLKHPTSIWARKYGVKWCHLFADSLEELNEFAAKLELKPGYLHLKVVPHYDLTPQKRRKALKLGAAKIQKDHLLALLKEQNLRKQPDWARPV